MTAAAAALFLLLASGESVRWSADAEVQARGRNEPTGGQTAQVGELALSSRLGLALQEPDGAASLSWSPRVLLQRAFSGAPNDPGGSTQQGGMLALNVRLTPTTRLGSRTSFDWGLTDFSPLSGRLVTSTGLLPSERFVRTLSLQSELDLRHRFSRLLELTATAGFQRSGGVGHDAVQVLPFQVAAAEAISLAWISERTGTAALQASSAQSRFSLGRTSHLTDLRVRWAGQPARASRVETAAGIAIIRVQGQEGAAIHAYGSGMAGAAWDLPISQTRRLSTSLHTRLEPTVDPVTGLAVDSLRGDGAVEFAGTRLRAGLSASGGRAVSGAFAGTEDLRLETHSSWNLSPGLAVEVTFAMAWTNQVAIVGLRDEIYCGVRWFGAGVL